MLSLRAAWASLPLYQSIPLTIALVILIAVAQNVASQLWFPNRNRPPVVFHVFPWIGSTVQYGMDPFRFFFDCQAKYGDCFTFILLGQPTTVYLGQKGNNFILNGKHADLNAEGIYGKLTTPIFGKGVIYDCPNEVLMDQKRLVKEAFTSIALRSYIPKFVKEVEDYVRSSPRFSGTGGICNITNALDEITVYTAASSLQGPEVRSKFDTTYAKLYRHLDDGFQPINFSMPWLPLPANARRDHAHAIMEELYTEIIQRRRAQGNSDGELDVITTLMDAKYKDGTPVPDIHIARLMIALLMAGQHNTASGGAWVFLNLANKPHVIEELYQEQVKVLGKDMHLTLEGLQELALHQKVIKETLRLHSPIHSILRQVTSPMPVPGTDWAIPPGYSMLAAPGYLARSAEIFPQPMEWDPHRWDGLAEQGDGDGDGPTVNYGFGKVSKAVNSPYLPFGAGRHRCVGEHYAYAQLGAILATMVRLLRWEQIDPKAPVPATDYSSMFSRPVNPSEIRWHRRS